MVSLKQKVSSGDGDYIVSWKSQSSNILKGLADLLGHDGILLTDVTLASDGEYIQAHKVVLSLCSPFFRDLFQKNRVDKSNCVVILTQVSARDIRYLLRYMYEGKVEIPSHDVDAFLKAGNILKIDGLTSNVHQDSKQLKPVASKDTNSPGSSRIHPSSVRKKVRLDISATAEGGEKCQSFGVADENSNPADAEFQSDVEDCNNEQIEARLSPQINHDSVIKTEPRFSSGSRQNSDNDGDGGGSTDEESTKGSTSDNNPSSSKWWDDDYARKRRKRPYRTGHPLIYRRPRSVAWNFFERAPAGTASKAKCKLCGAVMKTSQGSTSGLFQHLKSLHPGTLKKAPASSANPAPAKRKNRADPLHQEDAGVQSKSNPVSAAVLTSHEAHSEHNAYQSNSDSSNMQGILQGSYHALNDVG